MSVDEDEALAVFGLPARAEALPRLRALLAAETQKEAASQGRGDTDVMRLVCVQLFMAGAVDDCLAVWAAKRASMDANGAIDLELMLGAGLGATVAYLEGRGDPMARAALAAITAAVASGGLLGFTPAETAARWRRYYGGLP